MRNEQDPGIGDDAGIARRPALDPCVAGPGPDLDHSVRVLDIGTVHDRMGPRMGPACTLKLLLLTLVPATAIGHPPARPLRPGTAFQLQR